MFESCGRTQGDLESIAWPGLACVRAGSICEATAYFLLLQQQSWNKKHALVSATQSLKSVMGYLMLAAEVDPDDQR
eukprot:SAG31_NODE_3568_length_4117_cov_2.260080_1_plen_76_part_00